MANCHSDASFSQPFHHIQTVGVLRRQGNVSYVAKVAVTRFQVCHAVLVWADELLRMGSFLAYLNKRPFKV
jgi:hypothetical protein